MASFLAEVGCGRRTVEGGEMVSHGVRCHRAHRGAEMVIYKQATSKYPNV